MYASASPPLILSESDDPFSIDHSLDTPSRDANARPGGPAQGHTWSIECQGKLIVVKAHLNYTRRRQPQVRGNIMGFSRGSRLRLLKAIARMDWTLIGPSLFVTLTYPDERSVRRMSQRTSDRSQFIRAVELHLGRHVATIWRAEWKERRSGRNKGTMVSHVHLLLLGVEFIPWEKIRAWWGRILGWNGPLHTYVEATWDGPGASLYVAKYCSKVDAPPSLVNASYLNRVGRHWGLTRKGQIPRHPLKLLWDLTPVQVDVLRSVASGMLATYDIRYDASFTLLGVDAEKFARLFWESGLDAHTAHWYITQIKGGEVPLADS